MPLVGCKIFERLNNLYKCYELSIYMHYMNAFLVSQLLKGYFIISSAA